MTWNVYVPSVTGGPPGTPGPDHTVGTSDDRYPLVSWGAITFADPPTASSSSNAPMETGGTPVADPTRQFFATLTFPFATSTPGPDSRQVADFRRRRL